MKHKLLTIGFAIISLAAIIVPVAAPSVAMADHYAVDSKVFDPLILQGPLILCTGSNIGNTTQFAVCQNLCDLIAQIANVIYYMIAVVIWIIVPILAAVGGIMIMLGGANPEMIARGKKTITGAVWGLVIVLCAWLIVYTAISAFGNLGQYVGGFPGGPSSCTVAGVPTGGTTGTGGATQ